MKPKLVEFKADKSDRKELIKIVDDIKVRVEAGHWTENATTANRKA